MRAFIIRPFGEKYGVDFEKVHEQLIRPALSAQHIDIAGDTTTEIVEAGNIRADMFELILAAELVIADISVHNANVFYELGIRHAVRAQKTILIRSKIDSTHDVPFDLKTDRYLVYDNQNPAASLTALSDSIKQTIAADRRDSPVFALVPNITPMDLSNIVITPPGFSEELELARADGDVGKIRLLLEETRGFSWQIGAMRTIGKAAFSLKDFELAKEALERVRRLYPTDVQANTLLGTVYQRLGELTESDTALKRVLDSSFPNSYERAEVRTLLARNEKDKWEKDWSCEKELRACQQAALESTHLDKCLAEYGAAYEEDRNHYFSGVNILSIVNVKLALIEALPDIWEGLFDTEEEAAYVRSQLERELNDLAASVKLSIKTGLAKQRRKEETGFTWAAIALADYAFLTSQKITYIEKKYKDGMAGAEDFQRASALEQIERYQKLGLFTEKCESVIETISVKNAPVKAKPRVIIFSGHRVDSASRTSPRFPAEKEPLVRDLIKQKLEKEIASLGSSPIVGIAGAASGGDIIFHEVCAELNIPTKIYLAVPQREYIVASVADSEGDWIERFHAITKNASVEILSKEGANPDWLAANRSYDVWQRANLWMLHSGLAIDNNAILIALWNKKTGDGPGGTDGMISRAGERGMPVRIIDAARLLEDN